MRQRALAGVDPWAGDSSMLKTRPLGRVSLCAPFLVKTNRRGSTIFNAVNHFFETVRNFFICKRTD